MDNYTLAKVAQKDIVLHLEQKLLGCSTVCHRRAAERQSENKKKTKNGDASKLLVQSYFIINTSRAGGLGKHWLLLLLLRGQTTITTTARSQRQTKSLVLCLRSSGQTYKKLRVIF